MNTVSEMYELVCPIGDVWQTMSILQMGINMVYVKCSICGSMTAKKEFEFFGIPLSLCTNCYEELEAEFKELIDTKIAKWKFMNGR